MKSLVHFSIRHKSAIVMLAITAVIFGLVSVNTAKRELMPSMEMPMVMVDAHYPGASPQAVEKEVTIPLEQAIREVPTVSSISSSSSEGHSRITAEFEFGESSAEVLRSIQRATDQAASTLPDDVEAFSQSFSAVDIPIVMLAVSGDEDGQELAQPLEHQVVPELEAIPGVRSVTVNGIRDQSLAVTVDPDALDDADLDPSDVLSSLVDNGLSTPGGPIQEDGGTFNLTANSSLNAVEEVEDVWITPQSAISSSAFSGENDVPDPVRLSDVAEVDMVTDAETTLTRTNGAPSLGVIITKTPEGNTIEISDAVRDQIDELESFLGEGAQITVVFDQAPQILDSVSSVIEEGALGIAFALVVILLFLLSVRSTVVVAVSIPLALLLAVGGTHLIGYSLNLVTLGAIAVTVGRLVDDSIVVLENIKRHLASGQDRLRAVRDGTLEITTAVASSTVVTLLVFLPLLFVTGITGEVFRPFAAVVILALIASLLVALTVIPVLALFFLKRVPRPSGEPGAEGAEPEPFAVRLTPFQRAYRAIIVWSVSHRALTVAAGVLLVALTIGISVSPWLKTDFIGQETSNTYQAVQEMPAEATLEEADEEAAKVEEQLARAAWIESYQVTVGGNTVIASLGGAGAGDTTYNITTNPDGDQEAYWDQLEDLFTAVDTEYPVVLDDGSGDGTTGVSVNVSALDPEIAEEASKQVVEALEGIDGLTNTRSNTSETVRSYEVVVDGEEAAERGLTEGAVGQEVYQAFQGIEVGSATIDHVTRDIFLYLDDEPSTLADVEDIRIATPAGGTVRLSTVASVEETTTPSERLRVDNVATVTVTSSPTGDDLGQLTARISDELDALDLPRGVTTEMGGVSAEQDEAFEQMFYAMIAALAIAYMVLVVTFRSMAQPLVLMVSVPFAATGSIGLLLITGIPLGVPALIGLLMLIGIVITNAIVLMDLVNQYRAGGMELREAVIEGSIHRLRPIVMTAVSTIAALLPLALEMTNSAGAFMTQPLAVVTIGGLVSSTVLTLVFVPVLYTIVENRKLRRAERRATKPQRRQAKAERQQERRAARTRRREERRSVRAEASGAGKEGSDHTPEGDAD